MKSIIILVLFIVSDSSFSQNCNFNFQVSSPAIQMADDEQVIEYNVQVSRGTGSPTSSCSTYRIFFSKGQANSYIRQAYNSDGHSISYNLHKDINQNGVLKEFADALNDNERLQGTAVDEAVFYSNPFFMAVPGITGQNFPPFGTYNDSIQASIYGKNEATGEYVFEKNTSFSVSVSVPQRLDISLVDTGGVFDISATTKVLNFPDLRQPSQQSVDLIVRSNTTYQIYMSSMNNGSLKHSNGAGISYTLKINGSAVDLSTSASTSVEVTSGLPTTASGERKEIQIDITGDNSIKPSGQYQDSITITAVAI